MLNIKLEWQQSSFADSFDIFRATSPMLVSDMPEPIANTTYRYFTDTTINTGETYYYRVGAKRGNKILYSDEITILADAPPEFDPLWSNVQFLIFADATTYPSTNILDSSSFHRGVTKGGGISIINTDRYVDAGSIYFDGLKGQSFRSPAINIGVSDFTAECYAKFPLVAASDAFYAALIDLNSIAVRMDGNTLRIQLGSGAKFTIGDVTRGEWGHYCLMRKLQVLYFFIDGVKVLELGNNYSINSAIVFGGEEIVDRSLNAYLNCARYTTVARYSEAGFTPPDSKFPTS